MTDDLTVVLTLKNPTPDFLFQLGQATAIIRTQALPGNNTQPVGTGPFRLEKLGQGPAIVLARWD